MATRKSKDGMNLQNAFIFLPFLGKAMRFGDSINFSFK